MTPAELRRHLRQRRKELRAALGQREKAARERLATMPGVRRERQRRRERRLLMVLVLLSLVLVTRCECDEPPPLPPPPPAVKPSPEPPAPPKPTRTPPPKPPVRQRAKTKPRPDFTSDRATPPAWLDDFRLQVAARSPRLARCFDGAERPGALRWTASVNAASGTVFDHVLEPIGTQGSVSGEQRECLLAALANPAYRLGGSGDDALPERVSIAVEF